MIVQTKALVMDVDGCVQRWLCSEGSGFQSDPMCCLHVSQWLVVPQPGELPEEWGVQQVYGTWFAPCLWLPFPQPCWARSEVRGH
jgi:hypothetical protein